ncbi:hypothetical protein CBR_g50016 [Chara braunii]|uniref:GIY-YIG domain-containing protein n=1 Tax=Chara braunii TaxID=69332 RepID=A0A388K5B0_CHABU|nr:hypothetical protein CBR_g50016 [Chara braunii]|eukprot:GBG65225.1 hypothetical protein CBR_g50016 [Chara braunii]
MEEKREEKRKKIEEEQRRLKEEEDRKRELDIAKRTEEMKKQLQADIEEKWRRQQEEAANRAREERQETVKEAGPKISPQRKVITKDKAKRKSRRQTKKGNRGKTEARSSSSSDTSENNSTSASESSEDSEEEARRISRILRTEKQKWKPKRVQGRGRSAKRTPPSVYEKGECSRRSETPTTKGVAIAEPRTPLTGEYKGISAGCSREGFVDYTLKVLQQYSAKKVPELREMCERAGIKSARKDDMVMGFVKRQTERAYEGFFDAPAENDKGKEKQESQGGQPEDKTPPKGAKGEQVAGVERRITTTTILLGMRGEITWLKKYLDKADVDEATLDLRTGGTYVIAGPWAKRVYVGCTSRPILQRWREHVHAAASDSRGKAPQLYRWMRTFGTDKFVIIPVRHTTKIDDFEFDRYLIRDLSPNLNAKGTKGRGAKSRRRKGKRERKKKKGGTVGKAVVAFTTAEGKRTSLLNWLHERSEKPRGKAEVIFTAGEQWADGWKQISKFYGISEVEANGRKVLLKQARQICQNGGKSEVRRLVKSEIDGKLDDNALAAFVKKNVRVVSTKNKTVGQVIHNHRRYAHTRPASCPCEHYLLDKQDGHVLARVSEMKDVPMFVRNAKNVTRPDEQNSRRDIIQGINMAIAHLKGKKREVVNVDSCIKAGIGVCAAWTEGEVRSWASKYQGLVLVPVDRNPGDTALICPVLYRHGFGSTFTWNPDYESVDKTETEVLAQCKREFEEAGLSKIGKWKTDGRLGRLYVVPKDKDLRRWRPITPACNDPAMMVQRRGARALHCLVTKFSRKTNFHLRSTLELKEDLEKAGEILSKEGCNMAMGRCYDIKEMFSSISHLSVKKAVSDLVTQFEDQGWRQVRVAIRGKQCHLSKTDWKEPGFVTVKWIRLGQSWSMTLRMLI